ncbi:hypothetical protein ACLOJK_025456 [Asimina triloba]
MLEAKRLREKWRSSQWLNNATEGDQRVEIGDVRSNVRKQTGEGESQEELEREREGEIEGANPKKGNIDRWERQPMARGHGEWEREKHRGSGETTTKQGRREKS